jgi:hypothetical protein
MSNSIHKAETTPNTGINRMGRIFSVPNLDIFNKIRTRYAIERTMSKTNMMITI